MKEDSQRCRVSENGSKVTLDRILRRKIDLLKEFRGNGQASCGPDPLKGFITVGVGWQVIFGRVFGIVLPCTFFDVHHGRLFWIYRADASIRSYEYKCPEKTSFELGLLGLKNARE